LSDLAPKKLCSPSPEPSAVALGHALISAPALTPWHSLDANAAALSHFVGEGTGLVCKASGMNLESICAIRAV